MTIKKYKFVYRALFNVIFCGVISFCSGSNFDVDFVIYTFDRPMQVYALLESSERYLSGLGSIIVICRASSNDYLQAYKKVEERFKKVVFFYQGDKPHDDFKLMMMAATFDLPGKFIMFGVDDIIVKDFVNLNFCAKKLCETGAYGFYLRLGENITECYSENKQTQVPPHVSVGDGAYLWTFKDGLGDWRYPNNNDMTIYRREDIKNDLESINFTSTAYEGPWSEKADFNKTGLCFIESKIVNIPLNIVNEEYTSNRHMGAFTAADLFAKFNTGLKINIVPFYRVHNNAPHAEFNIKFIKR